MLSFIATFLNHVAITIHHLKKSFGQAEVFQNFSAHFENGIITAIVGPNGSGKSTLLNILSGITPKDDGEFSIKDFHPFHFSYIFQNYRESLLPWRTVFHNIALPLEIQKKTRKEQQQRMDELIRFLGYEIDLQKFPYELSGGQQQIVAFLRTLITLPHLLFIDEPFSALDYENNLRLREVLQRYYLAFRPTIILITHNIEEAVHLAQKIVVFSQKPTQVVAAIDNPLPYPRTIESLKSHAFDEVKDKVLSIFQKVAHV